MTNDRASLNTDSAQTIADVINLRLADICNAIGSQAYAIHNYANTVVGHTPTPMVQETSKHAPTPPRAAPTNTLAWLDELQEKFQELHFAHNRLLTR